MFSNHITDKRYISTVYEELLSPYDPAVSLLVIYPEETKTEKYTCIPLFTAALFTIARTWNGTPLQYSCLENSMDRGA